MSKGIAFGFSDCLVVFILICTRHFYRAVTTHTHTLHISNAKNTSPTNIHSHIYRHIHKYTTLLFHQKTTHITSNCTVLMLICTYPIAGNWALTIFVDIVVTSTSPYKHKHMQHQYNCITISTYNALVCRTWNAECTTDVNFFDPPNPLYIISTPLNGEIIIYITIRVTYLCNSPNSQTNSSAASACLPLLNFFFEAVDIACTQPRSIPQHSQHSRTTHLDKFLWRHYRFKIML